MSVIVTVALTQFSTPALPMSGINISWSKIPLSEAIAISVSLIAVVVSVLSFVITFLQTNRAQKTTLEAAYFTDIFKSYLLNHLPNARNKVFFANEEIRDIKDLIDNLNNLRRDAHYFRYSDLKFYKRLKHHQQKLEDMLVIAVNKTYDYDDQTLFLKKVDTSLRKIYKLINKRYYRGH